MHIARSVAAFALCFVAACASNTDHDDDNDTASTASASSTDWQPSGPYTFTVTKDVPYGPLGMERLDVCAPSGVTGPVPAFVVVHGGGFWKGDKEGALTARVCQTIASYGYVAFNVDYRLVQNDATTFPNPNAVNTFPDPLVDVQLAVRWVRYHAAAYGVDRTHICSWGDSAGATLATFLGVLGTIYPGDQAGLYPQMSPAVNCVIDNSGANDFRMAIDGPMNNDDYQRQLELVNSDQLSDLEAASPLLSVSAQSAPMIITQGTEDTTVLPVNATKLTNALTANGVPNQVIWYDAGHVFQGLPGAQEHDIIVRTITWASTHAAPVP